MKDISMFEPAMKIAKLLGIPFIILLHTFAVFGLYMFSGITVVSTLLGMLFIWSMFRKLHKVISMSRKRAELLIEVEEKMKNEDDDEGPTGFRKNNSIWEQQNDD